MKKFKVDYWPTTAKQIAEIVKDLYWQYDTVQYYEDTKQVFVVLAVGSDEFEAFHQGEPQAVIEFPWEIFIKSKNKNL